jgi:hypothetical protein
MRARNVARDRQAEAAAAFVLITRVVKPQEWLEHLLASTAECPAVEGDGGGCPCRSVLARSGNPSAS